LLDDAALERELLNEWSKPSEEEDEVEGEEEEEDGYYGYPYLSEEDLEQDLEEDLIEVYDQNGELVGTYSPAEFELLKAESV